MKRHRAALGQASLELLVLLAALFAFFTAFLPVIKEGIELAKFSAASKVNEAAFIHLTGMAKEASVLGKGNRFSKALRLEGNGFLRFNESTSVLSMNFSSGRRSKQFSAVIDFSFKLDATNFSSGNRVFSVENSGMFVEARISSPGRG